MIWTFLLFDYVDCFSWYLLWVWVFCGFLMFIVIRLFCCGNTLRGLCFVLFAWLLLVVSLLQIAWLVFKVLIGFGVFLGCLWVWWLKYLFLLVLLTCFGFNYTCLVVCLNLRFGCLFKVCTLAFDLIDLFSLTL